MRSTALAVFITSLAAFNLAAAPALAEMVGISARLDSQSEVPPHVSHARGGLTGAVDTVTGELTYRIEYEGLSGPVVAAHLHGPADVGRNAPPQVNIAPSPSPISGKAALTPAQLAQLRSGKWYVNLHSGKYPAGEVRGQVLEVQPPAPVGPTPGAPAAAAPGL